MDTPSADIKGRSSAADVTQGEAQELGGIAFASFIVVASWKKKPNHH